MAIATEGTLTKRGLRTREDGLYEIHGDDGEVILEADGGGLTRQRAEEILEALRERNAERR
jgi:hypothetical protein